MKNLSLLNVEDEADKQTCMPRLDSISPSDTEDCHLPGMETLNDGPCPIVTDQSVTVVKGSITVSF